jgi:hypothetical protein
MAGSIQTTKAYWFKKVVQLWVEGGSKVLFCGKVTNCEEIGASLILSHTSEEA